MNRDLHELRQNYTKGALLESELIDDPIAMFNRWFLEAKDTNIIEPNAMTLATVSANGIPSTRTVLLKELDSEGLIFYTNYESKKAKDIEANPIVSICFLWLGMERQVRFQGYVSKVPKEKSEAYFQSRPKDSQIGAWCSPQSQIIESRAVLDKKLEAIKEEYKDVDKLPLPPNWGGYHIKPFMAEFWQGRASRLHDRIRYEWTEDGWNHKRLAP